MNSIKILSIILLIGIGNILFTGCNIYNRNEKDFNDVGTKQEILNIYEYNDKFTNSYKKYIDPIYKEQYDSIGVFLLNQGDKTNYDYAKEYKDLLEIIKRNLIKFKDNMNNLVTEDIKLTKLNNELVEKNINLIKEIQLEIDNIVNIPVDKYSIPKAKFIEFLESSISVSKEVENEFKTSIKDIRTYLDIELNK